ncbi:hypothetical protein ACFFGR_06440 [Arthrobacter liuii]|uniref:Uncharacterized protein n=1 Tax=Arthrobacter liuii TaxID=1476996 RepID=A0ABQ2AUE4_9MICC|nr:hypothetical protein [Arthrobacter liuii]GGH96383.1 hypothetical protein GCM10007170_24100 [Arthrobacter liuii]
MDSAADRPLTGKIRPGTTSQGRIFHAFRGWPLVPAADLLLLRHAVERGTLASGPDHASDLLRLVDQELTRRAALPVASGD